MAYVFAIPDSFRVVPISRDSAGSEGPKDGTCSVIWHSFRCSSCGSLNRIPAKPSLMTGCAYCASHYVRRNSSGDGDGVDDGGDATVDGLDRRTCWVRWSQNRNSIEGRRGYAIHPLTDAQIAAGKLYQSQVLDRERMMNQPRAPAPKLTILVDQDIED